MEAVECGVVGVYLFGGSDRGLCGGVRVVPWMVRVGGCGFFGLESFAAGSLGWGCCLLCLLVQLLWVWSVGLSVVWSLIAVAEFLYLFSFGKYSW